MASSCNKFSLALLQRQYLAMVPHHLVLWPTAHTDVDAAFGEEGQSWVLGNVFQYEAAVRWPPAPAYTRAFLKRFIREAEGHGFAVEDQLYDFCGRLFNANPHGNSESSNAVASSGACLGLSDCEHSHDTAAAAAPVAGNSPSNNQSDASAEYCYKTYRWPAVDLEVTLREAVQLLSQGTTGLSTWGASLALCNHMLQPAQRALLAAGSRVVELGAGLGLASIFMAKLSPDVAVVATDYHPAVLASLTDNIALNHAQSNCKAEVIDWGECTLDTAVALDADVVVAADVVYDPSIVLPLVHTLGLLRDAGRVKHMFVACTQRNEATLELFRNGLAAQGLARCTQETDVTHLCDIYKSFPITLFSIVL